MNKEVQRLWVEALRSGEYPQTQDRLRDDTGYCCLGVLCDLYAKTHEKTWDDLRFPDDQVLPGTVTLWAGLPSENPITGTHQIAVYNDGSDHRGVRPHIFAEIADLIERYL